MKVLLIIFSVLISNITKAQHAVPSYFMGSEVMYTNHIRADGIISTDSSHLLIDIEHINHYQLDVLNTYRIHLGYITDCIGYKFSYQYTQENVFNKHQIQFGVQKRIGSRLLTNVMLGSEYSMHEVSHEKDLHFGLALRYRVNDNIYMYQETKKGSELNRNISTEHHSAIQYKVKDQFSTLFQLDYTDQFDARIALLLDYWKVKIQVAHRFIQNRIEIGAGFMYKYFDFNVVYSYHEILGTQSNVKVQIRL